MKPKWSDYFRCMLKSSEKCLVFYSPKCSVSITDADGGQHDSFGGDGDTRPTPQGIYIPPGTYEECPQFAYVNFNNEAVANGAPRFLTVDQFNEYFGATPWVTDGAVASEQATA